eukprot:scaffold24817_cov66-Phaeocystis_antarctica.AAC.4
MARSCAQRSNVCWPSESPADCRTTHRSSDGARRVGAAVSSPCARWRLGRCRSNYLHQQGDGGWRAELHATCRGPAGVETTWRVDLGLGGGARRCKRAPFDVVKAWRFCSRPKTRPTSFTPAAVARRASIANRPNTSTSLENERACTSLCVLQVGAVYTALPHGHSTLSLSVVAGARKDVNPAEVVK